MPTERKSFLYAFPPIRRLQVPVEQLGRLDSFQDIGMHTPESLLAVLILLGGALHHAAEILTVRKMRVQCVRRQRNPRPETFP